MIDPDSDFPEELAPDLDDLDAELASLHIEERPSFGPELRAELRAVWAEGEPRGRAPHLRRVAMTVGVVVAIAGLSVPPARAAFVRFFDAVQGLPDAHLVALPGSTGADERRAVDPTPRFVPAVPESSSAEISAWEGGTSLAALTDVAYPHLVDRREAESIIRRFYPERLQRQGVAGTVRLIAWIEATGQLAEREIARSSGVEALDRAALAAAPFLAFNPARRMGQAVGTWVEFDVQFVAPASQPTLPSAPTEADVPTPNGIATIEPLPSEVDALPLSGEQLLQSAFGDESDRVERLGTVEVLLSGEAPADALPIRWRDRAADALEDAITRDPRNPAPFLALGRIRRNQGLRTDARRLFERGVARAEAEGSGTPKSVAGDLHFERARMIEEDWLPWRNLGQLPSVALETTSCSRSAPRQSPSVFAAPEVLLAWNYLCPSRFDQLMRARFEELSPLKEREHEELVRTLLRAVEVFPGHPQASVALGLLLIDEGNLADALEVAEGFVSAETDAPVAALVQGIALQGLGRSAEALLAFDRGLRAIPAEAARAIRDVRLLGGGGQGDHGESASSANWDAGRLFWAALDPMLSTPVNEREVEHLARGAYAYLRFGGADTEAGEVWVRYGRPNVVRSMGQGGGLRTEFWDYGPGSDLTFHRPATESTPELTSEGRAYLKELKNIFPHSYAQPFSEIPVQAQLARFLDLSGEREFDIRLHAGVPEELSEADSLDVGVFFQGSAGQRWMVLLERRATAEANLEFQLEVPQSANRLSLEVVDPVSGRVASFRTPISAGGISGREASLSDLLLLDAAAPFAAGFLQRDARWMVPRHGSTIPASRELGVFFELYGFPALSPYRVQVAVEDLTSGEATAVPTKPAGELEHRLLWDRSTARRAGISREYLTLDLRSIATGSYLLRTTVRGPGGIVVESSRGIEIP